MNVLLACFGPSPSLTALVYGEKKSLTHDGQQQAMQAYATVVPLTTGFLLYGHRTVEISGKVGYRIASLELDFLIHRT
jgi:hypothetical protein